MAPSQSLFTYEQLSHLNFHRERKTKRERERERENYVTVILEPGETCYRHILKIICVKLFWANANKKFPEMCKVKQENRNETKRKERGNQHKQNTKAKKIYM